MSTQRDQFEEIYRWLSPSDPSTNYNRALQQRFEGTGRWFVESKVFTSFKAGQLPFLWLNGIPGCGKTVLSSSIVENLQQDSPGAPPLHFYFDFNDNRRQTLESAIRSLLWQATTHSGSSLGELGQLYNSCDKGKNQPSMLSLIQTLRKALRKLDHARLVLDALDECATKETLLAWLAQLAKHEPTNVQIIVTSRKEYEFETEFGNWLNDGAMVSLQQLDVDIGSYIHARLQTDPQLQRWQGRPDVQDEIEEKLRGRANGMLVLSF
jgi:Cdc6-like AAA superfamily ATPase